MNYHSTTNQKILGDFVAREVIMNASQLVDDLLECGRLDYEDIRNYYSESEEEPQEVYEWWFVTEWLFQKLEAQGEPVIDSAYGYLWGRCATGQAILLDGVIGRIAEGLEILEGQRYDWSKQ